MQQRGSTQQQQDNGRSSGGKSECLILDCFDLINTSVGLRPEPRTRNYNCKEPTPPVSHSVPVSPPMSVATPSVQITPCECLNLIMPCKCHGLRRGAGAGGGGRGGSARAGTVDGRPNPGHTPPPRRRREAPRARRAGRAKATPRRPGPDGIAPPPP